MSKVCGSTEPKTSVPMMASVPARWLERQRRIWLWATNLRMSNLTAAETLDSGEIASLPKRWTISLSGGERCSWRSRRLVCPTSNRSHLVSHPFSEDKRLRQRWRNRRLRNPLSGPLQTIHHGEQLLRVLVLLHCKGLFRRSMYIDGRAKATSFLRVYFW